MTERDADGAAAGAPAANERDPMADLTGELIRVSDDDIRAGILQRLVYSDRDIIITGITGTLVIAGVFTQIAPLWQVLIFVAARVAAAWGSHVLSRRVLRIGPETAVRQGYLLGMELWFAAVALTWSCAIFLAPSPLLTRPLSVLAVIAVIAVEGVTVLVASVSKRTILFVVITFWSCLTIRASIDSGDARLPFIVCIALYHAVLTLHAFNLQRQTVRNVRSEIVNRMLLDRVTQLHSSVRHHRDELEAVNRQLAEALVHTTELACYDPLTGVLNRRAFLDRVFQESNSMTRHGHGAALVLIDLDGFKAVNDTYGHAIGDAVLEQSAAALRAEMRGGDVFARWGGEEFIVMLPTTSATEAAASAERYRAAIATVASPRWPVDLHVTASFGVAEFGSPTTFDDALAAADRALYRAKADGRNVVRTAPPS